MTSVAVGFIVAVSTSVEVNLGVEVGWREIVEVGLFALVGTLLDTGAGVAVGMMVMPIVGIFVTVAVTVDLGSLLVAVGGTTVSATAIDVIFIQLSKYDCY